MSQKYKSISTDSVNHDETNIIVEMLAINKFGKVQPYCWRKNNLCHEFWKKNLQFVRRILKYNDITPAQLAFHITVHNISDISDSISIAKSIVVSKKMNKNHNLSGIVEIYRQRYNKPGKSSVEPNQDSRRRNIFDIMG